MRGIFLNSFRMYISPLVYLFLALLLLIVPFRWILAAFFSSVIHELCHILVICCFRLRIYAIRVHIGGAKIETEPMCHIQELVCALAGPMGGFGLLLFAKWIPLTALCATFQSLYNLFPVYPSDGARILRCGAELLLPEWLSGRLCQLVEAGVLLGAVVAGVYGTFYQHLGVLPVLISWMFITKAIKNKNPLQTGRTQGTMVVL